MNVQTLKGFRDFLPETARKRQYVIDALKKVFESCGFEPLETPALEYEDVLTGKYGEEGEKLMYKFEDNGGRKVALRYDQTVPLSRVVAEYQNDLPMPFKRYQVQPVWRAENTQRGRFREFLQCDIDTVGVDSALSDAEIIAVVANCFEKLGFTNFKVLVNDRENLKFSTEGIELSPDKNIKAVRVIDKLKKIGKDNVLRQLQENGFSQVEAEEIMTMVENTKPTQRLQEIFDILPDLGIDQTKFEFSPTLARGLDYYTGIIIEVEVAQYTAGSLGGGGRYDKLVGMFAGKDIPAVGFAFGFDRVMDAMEELKLFPANTQKTKVLVTIFSPEFLGESLEVYSKLKERNISVELSLDPNTKMEKQMKYANQKSIHYVVIIGPEEAEKDMVVLKNMQSGEQKQVPAADLSSLI